MTKLFLIAQGRAGSTLLQQIINKTTDYVIYGENNGFFIHLAELSYSIEIIENKSNWQRKIENTNKPSWLNDIQAPKLQSRIRQLAYEFLSMEHHGGFKEIRYGLKDYDELCRSLDFLMDLYPDAKIVFLKRDVRELVNSAWWKEKDLELLTAQQKFFERYCASHNCIMVDYRQLCDNDLKDFFSYIGCNYDKSATELVLRVRLRD